MKETARELRQENERIDGRQQRKKDVPGDPSVEFERRIVGNPLSPKAKSSGDWQGQLPQRALEPHGADHDAHQPSGQMRAAALSRLLLPIPQGDPGAGDEEGDEQCHQQPADTAALMVAGGSDQEQPGVIERVGAHRISPPADLL